MRELNPATTYAAIAVGMLCSLAGTWQVLAGSVALGGALILVSIVIAGLVWRHLVEVRRGLERR